MHTGYQYRPPQFYPPKKGTQRPKQQSTSFCYCRYPHHDHDLHLRKPENGHHEICPDSKIQNCWEFGVILQGMLEKLVPGAMSSPLGKLQMGQDSHDINTIPDSKVGRILEVSVLVILIGNLLGW